MGVGGKLPLGGNPFSGLLAGGLRAGGGNSSGKRRAGDGRAAGSRPGTGRGTLSNGKNPAAETETLYFLKKIKENQRFSLKNIGFRFRPPEF